MVHGLPVLPAAEAYVPLHCMHPAHAAASASLPPALQQAIFPGDSELQQLLHIFKLLGTPSEEVWPGVTKLRDWHEFPQWHPQDLSKVRPAGGVHGRCTHTLGSGRSGRCLPVFSRGVAG